MTDKPSTKERQVSTDEIRAKLEEIEAKVKNDLTSNQAITAIAAIAVVGVLTAVSYWLGRRSSPRR